MLGTERTRRTGQWTEQQLTRSSARNNRCHSHSHRHRPHMRSSRERPSIMLGAQSLRTARQGINLSIPRNPAAWKSRGHRRCHSHHSGTGAYMCAPSERCCFLLGVEQPRPARRRAKRRHLGCQYQCRLRNPGAGERNRRCCRCQSRHQSHLRPPRWRSYIMLGQQLGWRSGFWPKS